MNYKVSVIVPVYNVEKFLPQCIESLLAQTLTDIEIILVNDNSPDGSLQIIRKYEDAYPGRLKVIDSKVNLKQGGARNLGLEAATGEYIGFVDSDDYVAPEMFEKLYSSANSCNADAVFSEFMHVSEFSELDANADRKSDSDLDQRFVEAINGREMNDQDRSDLMCLATPIWTGIYKRQVIQSNGILFPSGVRYEDNFWSVLVKAFISKVIFINDVLYFYRTNSASTVHAMNQIYHFDRIDVENLLLEELQKRDLLMRYYAAIEYIFTFRAVFNTVSVLSFRFSQVKKSEIYEVIKSLKLKFPQWRKNKYYVMLRSRKRKKLDKLIYKFPKLYCFGISVLRRFRQKT